MLKSSLFTCRWQTEVKERQLKKNKLLYFQYKKAKYIKLDASINNSKVLYKYVKNKLKKLIY